MRHFLKNFNHHRFFFFYLSSSLGCEKEKLPYKEGRKRQWGDRIAALKKYFDANELYLIRGFLFMCFFNHLYCQEKNILELEIFF